MFWISKKMLYFIWINRKFVCNHIFENISPTQDSINERQLLVWVKKIHSFGCHQYTNSSEFQET